MLIPPEEWLSDHWSLSHTVVYRDGQPTLVGCCHWQTMKALTVAAAEINWGFDG